MRRGTRPEGEEAPQDLVCLLNENRCGDCRLCLLLRLTLPVTINERVPVEVENFKPGVCVAEGQRRAVQITLMIQAGGPVRSQFESLSWSTFQ